MSLYVSLKDNSALFKPVGVIQLSHLKLNKRIWEGFFFFFPRVFINRVGRQLCFSALLTADRPQADVSGHTEAVPWVLQTPAMQFYHGGAVPTSVLLDLANMHESLCVPR